MKSKLQSAWVLLAVFAASAVALVMILGTATPVYAQNQPNQPNQPNQQEEDQGPEVTCEDGGDLGWIVCPVLNAGVDLSDSIYSKFVEPLLSNVPISDDPKNGAYLAWKQFRLIGNILLVGALLAVVYSQARGGKN